MQGIAAIGASLASVPDTAWAAIIALIGVIGAVLRILPQAEAKPRGMSFSRLQVETARARVDEVWLPAAARVHGLLSMMDTDPRLKAQSDGFRVLHQMVAEPFATMFNPSRVIELYRVALKPPKADAEANMALAKACHDAACEMMAEGRVVLMPPRIHTRMTDLRDFAADAIDGKKLTQEYRFVTRGSDPLVTGLKVGRFSTPGDFYTMSLGRRYLSGLARLPATLLLAPMVYIGLFLSIVSLGTIQLKTVWRRSSVQSPLFEVATRERLRALEADMQRLNAG